MGIKFEVEVSVHIPSRGFAVVIDSDFNFSKQVSHHVLLYLKDGSRCSGVLASYHPSRNQKWGLFVKSQEIERPETVTIVAIELEDEV